jgi:hypothetical protein
MSKRSLIIFVYFRQFDKCFVRVVDDILSPARNMPHNVDFDVSEDRALKAMDSLGANRASAVSSLRHDAIGH